jgi:hypothetical protein
MIPYAAIRKLAQYLEHDERKHFEAMCENGEDVSEHIYLAVREVLEWLPDDEGGGGGKLKRKIGDFADFWRRYPDCYTPSRDKQN